MTFLYSWSLTHDLISTQMYGVCCLCIAVQSSITTQPVTSTVLCVKESCK